MSLALLTRPLSKGRRVIQIADQGVVWVARVIQIADQGVVLLVVRVGAVPLGLLTRVWVAPCPGDC